MARKKKHGPDYTLNIFYHYDEQTRRNVLVFLIQTTKIFVSFRYEILFENSIAGKEINLKITGLHVPELLMPAKVDRHEDEETMKTFTVTIHFTLQSKIKPLIRSK